MSDFYNKYPYTDFHELNLDWVIERVKKLTEDWLATQQEWNDTEEQWQQLHDYVMNYFANLDVSQEINNKIDAMVADGTFLNVIRSTVEAQTTTATENWLSAHITQPTTPAIDNTLTIAGAAADAKTVGNTIKNNIAAAYDSTKIYKINDYVTYNNTLYRCIYDMNAAETWAPHHWAQVSVGERAEGVEFTGETNLFVLKDSTFGFIDSSGNVTNSYGNNNTTTDFIPVLAGEHFTCSLWYESTVLSLVGIAIAAYDANKDFIPDSRVVKNSINSSLDGMNLIWEEYQVPANASYIRSCATLCEKGYAQLERGLTKSMFRDSIADRYHYTNSAIDYVLQNVKGADDYLLQAEWERGSLTNGAPTASITSVRMKNKIKISSPILRAHFDGTVHNIVVSFYDNTETFIQELVLNTDAFYVVPVNSVYIRVRIPYTDGITYPMPFDFQLIPFHGTTPQIGVDFFDSLVWNQGVFSTSTRTIANASDKITSEPFMFNGSGLYRFVYDSIYVDNNNSIWTRVWCFKKDGTRVVYERQAANQTSPWEFYIPDDGIAGFFEVQRAGGGNISPSDMNNAKINAFNAPEPNKFRYRLLTHNIGHFNYGGSGSGTENYGIPAPYNDNLLAWKNQLAEIRPDIFLMQEFTTILSQEDQTKNVSEFLDPIFNYSYNDGQEYGISSNITPHAIGSLTIGSANRTIRTAKYYLGHGKFLNIANVHLRYDDPVIRASEMQSLITAYADEEYVIIAGDFNEQTTSEADLFVTAGYTKCNGGYFGEFATYDNTGAFQQPLDQIVFKGNIKLLNLERKSYVTSDHYALICDLMIY